MPWLKLERFSDTLYNKKIHVYVVSISVPIIPTYILIICTLLEVCFALGMTLGDRLAPDGGDSPRSMKQRRSTGQAWESKGTGPANAGST